MRELLFRTGFLLKRPEVLLAYKEAMSHANWSRDQIREYQDAKVHSLIAYCFEHIPYYRRLASELGITAEQVKSVEDLAQFPILQKSDIRNAGSKAFCPDEPIGYIKGSTGGSTGRPLEYRLSYEDSAWSFALLFRGWSLGGYKLGDKMVVIAGASLTSNNPSWRRRTQDFIMNVRHYSSYGMGEEELRAYTSHMKRWRPRFLRGYATALFQLARYIEAEGGLGYPIEGVFSTAEVLTEQHRTTIEQVFNTKVFNNYGLNDGGLSAFECRAGSGMHIDFERGFLEVVDDEGKPIEKGVGRIVATSLLNNAHPFVRYDTGDLGQISDDMCCCGCHRMLLINVTGRITETLRLNGKSIGSPVLTVLMGHVKADHYKIRQTASDELIIEIVKGLGYSKQDEAFIIESITSKVGRIKVHFKYLDNINVTGEAKHKFIVNEYDI